jgi:WD40 repeat protein/serine/threonine protein kinase
MQPPASPHPSDQILRAFASGQLEGTEAEAISSHLDTCPECLQKAVGTPSDDLLDALRRARSIETPRQDQTDPYGDQSRAAPRPDLRGSESAASGSELDDALPPELASHPDYEIRRELGRGGMGVVYLAHNRLMGRDEVLKVMDRRIIERAGLMDRFLREIRSVAQLRHPNIVTAYTAFRCGESLAFAMEYVEGLDLARMVKARGLMPVGNACSYIHQAALGLQHAHEQGMVHRDIKPGNLMLSRSGDRALIKVLDFGLAKAGRENRVLELDLDPQGEPQGHGADLTLAGQMLGTPAFIAPEQIDDAKGADIRADIYSLGCTLYYLLSGGPPFQAETLYDMLQAHHSMDARLLNFVRPEVPAELAALVAKMMAKEPERRFQTPGEVAKALQPFFKRRAQGTATGFSAGQVDVPAANLSTAGGTDVAPLFPLHPVLAAPTGATRNQDRPDGMWRSQIATPEPEVTDQATLATIFPQRERRRRFPRSALPVVLAAILLAAGIVYRKAPWGGRLFTEPPATGTGRAGGRQSQPAPEGNPRSGEPKAEQGGRGVAQEAGNASPLAPASSPRANTSTGMKNPGKTTLPDTIARGPSRPIADTSRETGSRFPTWDPGPADLFHKVKSIKSPGPVIQARLISAAGHVLFETGGKRRALYRFDLKDQGEPHRFDAEVPDWSHLAISSDGRLVVVAAVDGALWLWDLQVGQARRLLRPSRKGISAVALSPDNRLVAYVRSGAVYFCEATGDAAVKRKESAKGIGEGTDLIAFSPEGQRLISTHADQSIRVWDVKKRREIGPRSATTKPASGLAIFPDGRRALVSLSGPTFVWDLEKNRQVREAPGFGQSIALSADGRRALIGGGNSMVVWDLVTGGLIARGEHHSAVLHVAFSSDERQAVSVTSDNVYAWALPRGLDAGTPPVVELVDFDRLGKHIIYDWVAVSPRNSHWALTCEPNALRFWDIETGKMIRKFNEGAKRTYSVAFSPDGGQALSGGDDGDVSLWDLGTGQRRELRDHTESVLRVAFSPDGKRAYSAGGGYERDGWHDGKDYAIRMWDLETGRHRALEGHKGIGFSLAVSADGRYLLSGGGDAVAILWDARTGREVRRFRGHTARLSCVAFLPDNRRALSCSGDDGTIRLWDVETGEEIRSHFKEPTSGAWHLAVSPDGRRLFSNDGKTLKYWNLDTGKVIQKLEWEELPARGSFCPDGRHVVWGGWGGILRLYRLTDQGQEDDSTASAKPVQRNPNAPAGPRAENEPREARGRRN